jgi:ceramide glucosyltransferase
MVLYLFIYVGLILYLDAGAREAVAYSERLPPGGTHPPVTVIVPVFGADRFTEGNFRSWLEQDYGGEIQYIFSLQRENDPAFAVLDHLSAGRSFVTTVNPVRAGYSGKTSNLHHGLLEARHEILVFSDCDMRAPPNTLQKIVRLIEEGNDLVSCLPRHVEPGNTWGELYAGLWNLLLLMIWAPQRLRGRDLGVAGGTVAIKRRDLDRLGGIEAFKDYLAEDFAIGKAAQKQGLKIALGPPVTSFVGSMRFRELFDKCMRTHLISIHMSPLGLVGSILLYLFFPAYLLVLGYALWRWNLPLLLSCLLFMMVKGLFGGRLSLYASGRFRIPYAYPLGDLLMPITFLYALLRPRVSWGGLSFRVSREGKLKRLA